MFRIKKVYIRDKKSSMITSGIYKAGAFKQLQGAISFAFSVQKKPRMEYTIRTPYKTFMQDYDGVHRLLTKTNESALVVQNRFPPSAFVLPPGHLKVKFTQELKDTSGDYLHLGGWLTVHP